MGGSEFILAFGLAGVLPIGLVVLGILAFASNREVDPSGRRAYAVYLNVVSFVAVFTMLFGAFAAFSSLLDLARDDDDAASGARVAPRTIDFHVGTVEEGGGGRENPGYGMPDSMGDDDLGGDDDFMGPGSYYPLDANTDADDAAARGAVGGLFVTLASGAAFWYHRRLQHDQIAEPGYGKSVAARVEHARRHAGAFVAVVVAAGATIAVMWGAFHAIAPGVASSAGDGERMDGVLDALAAAFLGAGAIAIAASDLRRGRELREALQPAAPDANGTADPVGI